MNCKRISILFIAIAIAFPPILAAEPRKGSVCIAPIPRIADPRSAPGLHCKSEKLSFTIDSTTVTAWPNKDSVKIDLDPDTKHRVTVFCNGGAQQSFSFKFSEYKSSKLCLFINDFYKTVQLWEDKQSPWCKCK